MLSNDAQCPACGGPFIFSHEDDLGTRFYQCQKCGSTHSVRATAEELETYTRLLKGLQHKMEDKPKGARPRCGACAAYHTPFCSWAYKDEPSLKVRPEDYACSRFYARPQESHKIRRESFSRRVANL